MQIRLLTILCLCASLASAADSAPAHDNVQLRRGLPNSRIRFEQQQTGHVAFIGGSITEMNGYRPMVCDILRKRFPHTRFTFTDAGISSTCSTTGAMRLHDDVLSKGPVDLFFIEFAVNDDQDAHHARRECIRGMEGIIRQTLRHNPRADIVITHFVNPGMMQAIRDGNVPLTIAAHEAVADHYGIPTINLAREVTRQIASGQLTWDQYGGVHPAPRGNAICAGMIDTLMQRAWARPLPATAALADRHLPDPLDPFSYANGRFIAPTQAAIVRGWSWSIPDWKSLKGSTRDRFRNIPMLWADQPGAQLMLEFEGAAIGAYIVAGPDAGIVEASIDGGEWTQANLLHAFSENLHYPRTVMFATDLKPGPHTLTLRIPNKTAGTAHAARIIQFVAN